MENIHTKPESIPNQPTYLADVSGVGMIRSSSQSFSPLRPNLPQELFKKQQNEDSLVKHIMNNKILHSRFNSEEVSPSPNHFENKFFISPDNKISSELSSISNETLLNMDNNEINDSLLELEILKNKLISLKDANNLKRSQTAQELDNTFINNKLNESNVLSNKDSIEFTIGSGSNSSSDNSIDKTLQNIDENKEICDNQNSTSGKKIDYIESLHQKILSEKNSPSKLSENYVLNDDDDECYFKIYNNENNNEYDKNKTIILTDPNILNQSIINSKVKLLSRSKNFESLVIDLKDRYCLGRNNNENRSHFIVFNSLVVSRHHAEIFIENNKFFIIDVGSNGGTFINGKRISKPGCKSEPVQITPGDIIQLGQDYIENDRNQQLDESIYQSVVFEITMIDQPDLIKKKALDSIINIYGSENKITRTRSDFQISKKSSSDYSDYENSIKIRGKTRELYDSKLIDESTQYQLALYEKTKNLNDEYSNENSHLLDNVKESCLQFFFVVYSDKKKLNKIQILNENTECIFEVALKDWVNKRIKYEDDNKGKMHITDKREEYSPTSSIKVNKIGNIVNIQAESYQFGFIEKVSDMKYIVETPGQNDKSPQFVFTGDFEQHNWLCITKFKDSRKQRCIGEAKGKQLVEKSTKQRKWVVSIQLETGNYSQLLLSAVTYIIAITGPYY
ncbi:hypothetical protein BCR36DRAFT_347673 [Piromyces finnis]|uniref:FHA domain-containing protein n=1 Tax=Piromyces finnis TaxID=1754191 RepID=A0A1Y1VG14_9FUNG|nr:hypothetical protein BCR36DRAFT_347673 [Piromyces finnis]|eukprot:ORX54712.1 hypothetical protein BCR36DRAFT_347673 [Piromyces finnis]